MDDHDVLIVGGGVVGCSIARGLSRYNLDVCLLEKEEDVASGVSKANSGVIHSGIYYDPDTIKSDLCVEGNKQFDKLCDQLDVPLERCGKHIVARKESELQKLEELKETGEENGVPGLEIIDGEEVKKSEPEVSEEVEAGIYSPSTGIVDPFLFTIGLAENAHSNGVKFEFKAGVNNVIEKRDGFKVSTEKGEKKSDYVINAAGLNADVISEMLGEEWELYPCRGEYLILDKRYGDLVNGLIYPVPPEKAGVLGIHITPTTDDNILLGPSSEFVDRRDNTANTEKKMEKLLEEAVDLVPGLPKDGLTSFFASMRPKITPPEEEKARDFVIENQNGFINMVGIESPGLTSAPAIADRIVETLNEKIGLEEDEDFNPVRKGIDRVRDKTPSERNRLVEENSDYGKIVCECRDVSLAEIKEALDNPFGADSLDAVKKRTKAMMGRCQGGQCLPETVEILKGRGKEPSEISKSGGDDWMFSGKTKGLKR